MLRQLVLGALAAAALAGCDARKAAAPEGDPPELVDGLFTPEEIELIVGLRAPGQAPVDSSNRFATRGDAAVFGRALFFETRLSSTKTISCASCHDPAQGFSVKSAKGQGLRPTQRHPPGLLNVAYQQWYDWDGKADSLWAQAVRPIESEGEQGFSRLEAVHTIAADDALRARYVALFGPLPEGLDDRARFPARARPVPDRPDHPDHVAWMAMAAQDRAAVDRAFSHLAKALAAYQMQLVRLEAPIDRYIDGLQARPGGDRDALSPQAKRGLKLFVDKGLCINCHNGPMFSDMSFHNLGLPATGDVEAARDPGRWAGVAIAKASAFSTRGVHSDDREGKRAQWLRYLKRTPENRGQFKTPSLRNVALTPPYMHSGQFDDLEAVVAFYNALGPSPQVGHREELLKPLGLSGQEQADLVAFLRALTGAPLPEALTRKPQL